jgi:hypothetical protein
VVIWEPVDDKTAVRYRCLMNQATQKVSVQSADIYRLPIEPEQVRQFDAQFVELLCECDPSERAGSLDSIAEAIAAHKRSFDQNDVP